MASRRTETLAEMLGRPGCGLIDVVPSAAFGGDCGDAFALYSPSSNSLLVLCYNITYLESS